MNIVQINQRLQELINEERVIRSKLEYKRLSYNKEDWFPSDKKVRLLDHEIVIDGNNGHCYISYLESNNSFDLAPKHSLFDKLNLFSTLHVSFQGEKSGDCDIRLFVITYVHQIKKEIYSIPLNSKESIEIDAPDIDIRLAIRVQGNGRFKLDSIVLEPGMGTYVTNIKDFQVNFQRQITNPRKLKVAMVVDEFTYESLRHECEAIYLSPDNWLQTMRLKKPDLFFCESAWAGKDPDKREWRGKIYSSINFNKENRTELLKIIQYCKENGIVTVFWNKEDPSHFDDKVHNFVDTALKFDYIFTTAEECVERYKKEYNHNNVYPLMFAVQPKQFNPIETCERTDEIIFSGSYYRQHPQRCKVMDQIFNLIIQQGKNLVIYDRQYYNQDENHTFPQQFQPYIRPRLPYTRLDKGYKGSKFALNINTETESNTMFARRVFELMASNTLVISNYSKGLEKHFGDLLFLLDITDLEQSKYLLTQAFEVNYEKHRLKALRNVLMNHTYEERFAYILDVIGIEVQRNIHHVCSVIFVNNEEEIEKSIELFENQTYRYKQLLIINKGENSIETANWLSKYGNNSIYVTDLNMLEKYGKNLEDLIDTEYVAFMDLNHFYGSNYLLDMLLSYKYLSEDTIVVKNLKYQPYRFVNEASIFASVLPKKALQFFEYDLLKDDYFISKLFEVGYRLFNCDQFNILFPNEITSENMAKVSI